MQEGITSVDRPRIGVLVDDPSLSSWLPGILGGDFHLVVDEPDGIEMASVVLYLLDRQALARRIAWLRTSRAELRPDSTPVLLLSADGDEVAADELSLVDARISVTLSGAAFCEQIMHWVHLQASAQLWALAASGSLGQPAADRLLPVEADTDVGGQDLLLELSADSRLALLCKLANAAAQGMFICDALGVLRWVNPAFCALCGYTSQELIGRPSSLLLPLFMQGDSYEEFRLRIRQWQGWDGELNGRNKLGESFPFWLTLQYIPGSEQEDPETLTGFYTGIVTDLRTSRQLEECVLHLSRTGSLSELNRILVEERLTQDIRQAERSRQLVAVLHVDLRRFRSLNEKFGYAVGDWLLMSQLQRLQALVGDRGLASRLAANHYAVILPRLESLDPALELAEQIVDQLSLPLQYDNHDIICPPVVGISDFPEQGRTALELMSNADTAVDWCRTHPNTLIQRFSSEQALWLRQQTDLLQGLRHALDHDELFLEYQPQLNMRTGKVTGVEALIRWRTAERIIPPKEFIPLAEEGGLIVAISDWVLKTACQQAAAWLAEGLELNMAVNLSAVHFQHGLLVEQVAACLASSGLPAERLELEVTEGCIMADVNQAISTLNRLKQLGVTLSVDDFGTGYSSLSYLKLFPLDKLKIDQSFVFDLLDSNSDAVIVRAIIALGHAMGLIVIAEGVETQEQYAYLRLLHCDEMQGFLRGRPTAASQLPALVAQIASTHDQSTTQEGAPSRTLLLVDDEPSILSALRRTLRSSGYQIMTAATAEAALDCMAHYQIGVIVSDNRMPGVTGLELLRQIKARYPHTVRVMLSGYADLEALSSAVNAGEIFRFISKPWEEGELKVAINDAFDKYDEISVLRPSLF